MDVLPVVFALFDSLLLLFMDFLARSILISEWKQIIVGIYPAETSSKTRKARLTGKLVQYLNGNAAGQMIDRMLYQPSGRH
ncbi:hypothetical protein GCK72_026169 [Caenorhabditis remanei]|uniref:Uncharacterized protein n=1 Tax=Caenorhabditis remanei TaxID=31234 RepID=A0A6A5G4P6_CAERE|nr:hypothetical protein GCK72_026169 [Caenorhabditis remanei]KAF1749701.1 hypothetical protein GCK72_026169 [Caenorhabditis remanei]